MSRFPDPIAKALGAARTDELEELRQDVGELGKRIVDVYTTDVLLIPLKPEKVPEWKRIARQEGETWVFVGSTDGVPVLALDEPSETGMRDHAAAVIYPELHMRLVSWWLVHAWRAVDLLEDTLDNLHRWRVTSGAVTARALVEEAGALAEEAKKIAASWSTAKNEQANVIGRPAAVREALAPILLQAGMGSRLKGSAASLQATNVLTLVQKLSRETGDVRFIKWYDWLSDSAHPAFGARIAFSTPPLLHESKATMLRYYSRSPMSLDSESDSEPLEPTIAFYIADALMASGKVILETLDQILVVIDDFGLTTAAATLTRRSYWRNFQPTRGSRMCPCGRGKWSQCRHHWGESAPELRLPKTGRDGRSE